MAARYDPSLPTELPAYKLPTSEVQDPPSSPTGQGLFHSISPMGCELAVHNVSPTESLPTSADVIDHALCVIHDANPELIPVHATFRLKDTPSLCSVMLRDDVADLDSKPRPDLLEPWIELLRKHNPEWEVDWACATPKNDKRLWVVLKGVDREVDQEGLRTVELAREELERMGYQSVGGVMASSDSAVIKMASLQSAQSVQSKNSLKIPILSEPLVIDRFHTVQPEWAFELIITGLNAFPNTTAVTVKNFLDTHFRRSYVLDGQTLWHRSRLVDDAYYCFMMKDWDATLQVLKDKDYFEARCGRTLSIPRLIFEFNGAGGFHKSIARARRLKAAGSSISGEFSNIHLEIQILHQDMVIGFDEIREHNEAVQQELRTLTNVVDTLNDQVKDQSQSILTLQNGIILQERRARIDAALNHKFMLFNSPLEEEQTRAEIRDLQMQRKVVDKELVDLWTAVTSGLCGTISPLQETTQQNPCVLNELALDTENSDILCD